MAQAALARLRSVPPECWWVYVNVAAYAGCYMMEQPALPRLAAAAGADEVTFGALQSAFGAAQLVGGLAAGPLVDRYGPRALLVASYAASALCYSATAAATGLPMLFLSRAFTVLQHAVLAARALVTAATSDGGNDRAVLLGYIGVAYGVGFTVGPALGGWLTDRSLRAGVWAAAAGSVASLVSVLALLPPRARPDPLGTKPRKPLDLKEAWRVCVLPGVPSLLVVKALTGLAAALFHSVFTLAASTTLALSAQDTGLIISYMGLITLATQAGVIDWATLRYDDDTVVTQCSHVLVASFMALALVDGSIQLCAVLAPMLAAGSVLATVNTAQLTKAAPATDAGTIIAVDMAIGSGLRIVCPPIGAWLLRSYGLRSVGAAGAAAVGLLVLLFRTGAVNPGGAPVGRGANVV